MLSAELGRKICSISSKSWKGKLQITFTPLCIVVIAWMCVKDISVLSQLLQSSN